MAIFTSLSLFFCVASFSFSSISFFEGGCGFEVNKYSGTSNTFAAIVFNGKKNNKLTFTDCTITVKAEGDQAQYLVGLSGTGNEVYFKGNTTITGTHTLADASVAYFASGMTEEDWIVDLEDTVVFNWSKD